MYEYDDSEDYSSANSFRARSNTWPLNRPDLGVPNGVCIDETLPEIELEEDDLFTTNENWSMNLDHDIMSWDPILNGQQNSQQPQQQQQQQQHHHQQQQHHQNNQQPQQQATLATNSHQHNHQHHHHQQPHNQHQPHNNVNHHHQQQQHHNQPPPPLQQQRQQTVHHHQHLDQHAHQIQQHNESIPCCPTIIHREPTIQQHQQIPHQHNNESTHCGSTIIHRGQIQQEQQILPPQQLPFRQQQPHHHQTLNNTQCIDADDPNEYHIHQMHNLRLDNYPPSSNDHQTHYSMQPMNSNSTTLCNSQQQQQQHGSNLATLSTENYNISPDHHQHHHNLQPLNSARYDPDQQNDLDSYKAHNDNDIHNQHQQTHHHLHQLTSTSLTDHHSHALSSSLSTSGIGLSGDLEELDYKNVDPSLLLSNSAQFDDQDQQDPQQQQLLQQGGGSDSGGSNSKQSNSTASSKTKLNTPRRNAWGNMSYADLISQAIDSTNDKRLTLSQIYDWMVQNVPYFKDKGDSNSSAGWKNSVRHNLSLHNRFKRLQNEGTGKSSWWTINPEANIGKCARRRAASMEASKYEKKRGRAKKRADAIRQGLISYPSLTNSSLNGSTGNLEIGQQQQPLQPLSQPLPQTQQQQQTQQVQSQPPPAPQPQQHQTSSSQQFGCQEQQQQQQQQTDGLFNLIICDN